MKCRRFSALLMDSPVRWRLLAERVLRAAQQVFLAVLASRWSDRLLTPEKGWQRRQSFAAVLWSSQMLYPPQAQLQQGPLRVEYPYFCRFKALLNSPAKYSGLTVQRQQQRNFAGGGGLKALDVNQLRWQYFAPGFCG